LFPWEEDLLASPWKETSGSGVADTVEAPVSEIILAKASCTPDKAPSLIRRGFFGPRVASSSPSRDKEVPLSSKGKGALPSSLPEKSVLSLGAAEVGLNPTVSKSQVVNARRVKDEISKQLLKNKELLAEVVVDIPAEGYSKEVIRTVNFAPVVGLSWGGDDKRMLNLLSKIEKEKRELANPKVKGKRELKNLECSFNIEASGQRSSQAKCRHRWGFLRSKNSYSFLPKVQ
jgi:hypothetical protein